MALPNTRVVRRSAALSKSIGKYYGDDFLYSEGAYYSKKGAARKVTLMTLAMGLVIISPLRKLLRGLFRKPGEGPSQKQWTLVFLRVDSWWKQATVFVLFLFLQAVILVTK